ncbi:efflux RND transporter periplasmic adaptor subunit [Legionella longbeachae]|uniref:Putative cation efflux system protein n=1 Tax=Legionella longbeachae serogroup 1 (strain NSW150) TaxID=661367 RepID=D3HMZ4_LEGLN|nr:efflux RND transporter periplasmic adaptor subunit [Legionella longbeachae]VEE04360.1 cation efflux system protein [Legionella oakridgensis]HBD7397112.1 efflux RND transporter periplasmic adaptor subunit [Legionella pneumophila]ARB92818.1 efflux RND transporter periplasmic adaptor subunit [Legionella longbeachae]ARM34018.1 efflux RND transporter periplasmic adaptor subunit [Legionella longbeachae]EEZ96762.1 RND family efflux transporter [Legionella longbeachae D-4968]
MDIRSLFSTFHEPDKNQAPSAKIVQIIILLFLLLIIILLIRGCLALLASSPKKAVTPMLIRKEHHIFVPENSPLRAQLIVRPVKTSNKPHRVFLPGVVEADPVRTVNIFPPLTGHLTALKIKLGDEVKHDQVLATLQSAGLAQAYSDLAKALSILKQTQETLNRAQKVNRAGANSVKDIEQAQSSYTQAFAEVQRAQATLKSLGNNEPGILRIQAPIDGKVIAINYGIGSYINDPATPILTLSNIQSVWIAACVPEHLIALVNKGLKTSISLIAYPHQVWEGQVAFIDNLIDPFTRCNKTRIAFANANHKLQPNMFATVQMDLPQEEQVIVPLSAIIMNDDATSVYVETAPWTFESRAVVLGPEDKNMVRITSGLKHGDRIVASGGILVND